MARFEYNSKDQQGRPIAGRIEAVDFTQAIARLSEQGVFVRGEDLVLLGDRADGDGTGDANLMEDEAATSPEGGEDATDLVVAEIVTETASPRLSGRERAQLIETVVDLTSSDLPLSAGLRATAEEIPQLRLAAAMRRLAAELDRGVSLDRALGTASKNVPDHLRGLILAGLRTGRVAHVLEELVAMDRDRIDLRRRIVAALTYPTILMVLLAAAFVFGNLFIVRPFSQVFDEFGMDLPDITRMMIALMHWLDHSGLGMAIIVFGIVLPSFVALILIPKPPDLQRACYHLPIIGPLWRWQSLVDFSRLMHLFLARQVPMAEALRFTADGLRWSDLAAVSRAMRGGCRAGNGAVRIDGEIPRVSIQLASGDRKWSANTRSR